MDIDIMICNWNGGGVEEVQQNMHHLLLNWQRARSHQLGLRLLSVPQCSKRYFNVYVRPRKRVA